MATPTRRGFIQHATASALAPLATRSLFADNAGGASDSPSRARHNFLFILTDDQRWDALGAAGNPLVRTPSLDALAAQGCRFENAFVTLSICGPSRGACLSGMYGSRSGADTNGAGLRPGVRTFAHHLRRAGYRTAHVGKWHLRNDPYSCGFQSAVWFVSNGPHHDRKVKAQGIDTTAPGYIERYNADQSIRFMEGAAAQGAPFALFHCTQVPHMTPQFDWVARPETLARFDEAEMPLPKTWRDDLSGKPPYLKQARSRQKALEYGYGKPEGIRRHLRRYYASIADMDEEIGRLLSALDRLGLRDNTYILFMGDNGWFLGEHGFTSKVLAYEESMRVPMVVAGPGIAPRVDKRIALNIDLAPTMLDLVGLGVPAEMDGRSLRPLLMGDGGRAAKAAMTERGAGEKPWRTRFLYEAHVPALGSWPHYALRTEEWKYIRTHDLKEPSKVVFEELYDLRDDPTETKNMALNRRHKEVLDEMSRALEEEVRAVGEGA